MAVHPKIAEVPERFVPEAMQEELIAAEHVARYEWAAALAPGRRVLDAGCGTGYGAAILAVRGADRVLGVDVAAAVVDAARSRGTARLEFDQADIARLPHADASFDLITCFEVIEHVREPSAVLGELARVLAPGGVLAISSPNADRYPPRNPHHVREFTTSEFRALLAEAFPAVRLLAQHQWVSSAVFEERDLDPGALSVRTVKTTSRRLGSETYTVALAGSGALPEPPATAALTGTLELRRWLANFDAQQRVLADQADYLAGLEELDAERRDLRRQLVAAETELAELHERVFGLERVRHGQLEQIDDMGEQIEDMVEQIEDMSAVMDSVWTSVSWRTTRPLRATKRLFRRRRAS